MATVADKIIDTLQEAGVKRFYGLIGDSLNEFGRAVSQNGKMKWISVRHEEIGAFAAGGEALLSKNLCVCAGTSGPGSLHLINGLYEAKANHCPVLAIVTHMPSAQVGLDYFQVTQPMIAFKDCSVYCDMLFNPDQMPRVFQAAIQAAISKQSVAVVIVPGDIAKLPCPDSPYAHLPVRGIAQMMPKIDAINAMSKMLNEAQKVAFLCGIGCKDSVEEVKVLAAKMNAPIVHTIRAKDLFEPDNPFNVGGIWGLGTGSSEVAINECDCLLMLGTDFPFTQALPTHAKMIQVDVCGANIGRRGRLDLGVVGDVKSTIEAVLPFVEQKNDVFLKEALTHAQKATDEINKKLLFSMQSEKLQPDFLTRTIGELAPDNAIFVPDVGLNDVWLGRYLNIKKGQSIVGSFKHGTMGAGLGQAIGMASSEINRPIIYLAGDGNLSMFLGDLMTIERYKLPIKIIVYNNHQLGFIDLEAIRDGYKPFATELPNPSFAKIAEAMDIQAMQITSNRGLKDKLKECLSAEGSILIDCLTDPAALGG